MYKDHNQLLPLFCFQFLFTEVHQIHNYNTRHASKLSYYLPKVRTNYAKFNIHYYIIIDHIPSSCWVIMVDMVKGRQHHSSVLPQGLKYYKLLFERAPYLGGGPFSTCPFSITATSGKSPLSVLATLDNGPLVYELFDELEPVLGLGTGEDDG